jgi:histone H3/H4
MAIQGKNREARSDGGPNFQRFQKEKAMAAELKKAKLSAPAGGSGTEVVRKKKFRPGAKMILEIRKMQKSTKPMLRFAPFTRLVRERGRLIMEDALLCCLHRKVKGVQVKDIRLAERIRQKSRPTDWKREHLTAARVKE